MASQDGVLGQYTHGFAVFGAIAASYVTLKFLCSLWSGLKAYVLAGSLGLRADLKKMGQWAGECEPAGLGSIHTFCTSWLSRVSVPEHGCLMERGAKQQSGWYAGLTVV